MGLESNSDVKENREVREANENAADEAAEKKAQDRERGSKLDDRGKTDRPDGSGEKEKADTKKADKLHEAETKEKNPEADTKTTDKPDVSEEGEKNPEAGKESPEDTADHLKEEKEDSDSPDSRKDDLDEKNVMSPALQEMYDYMSEHDYGYGDYPTYSQDPEWQRLNENLKNEDAGVQPEKSDPGDSDSGKALDGSGGDEILKNSDVSDGGDALNDPEQNIEDSRYRTVDANAIDMTDARGMDDPNFWNHHGNSKETYMDMAEKLPDIQKELGEGKSLDELKENPDYADTVNAYYNPDNMVKVEQKPDGSYAFQDDGRHRVEAAREAGVSIPVEVVNSADAKTELQDTKADSPEKTASEVSGENGEQRSEGRSIKEIENSDGAQKSMGELRERFDDLNEKYENTDASTKEGKDELGRLYGENMGAIKDTHEKYDAEMSRQKELSQEMSDLHNQYDSDFPPDVQKHYDGLVKEYRDCQNHAEELKYQEAKLESNNVHIAEQLDKPYVPTSDMNGAQNRQQKMDGLQSSLNDLESKIDAGKATPMDAYEFASTKQMMKGDIAHPANRNEPFGVKDPESLGKMDAQVDRISDKLAEQFKDYKFHDDGTYTRTTEKSWDAYGVKTGAREYTDREGNRITKSSEISVGSGQGKIERTADIYTDKGRRLDASVHFDGFRTRSEKTIEGADHSCSFEEKEHRALGGDVKTSYDAQKKTADISAEGNLAARSSGKISETADGSMKSTQTETTLGNIKIEGQKDLSSFNRAEVKGSVELNAAKEGIHRTVQNADGRGYSLDLEANLGHIKEGIKVKPSDLEVKPDLEKPKAVQFTQKEYKALGEEDKKK